MSVKSARRVLMIFDLLAQHTEGLNIKVISDKLIIPQSSTSNLVHTLYKERYLSRDSLKTYKLGPKLIQIGTLAINHLDISSQGRPYLKKLMESVQETVFMAMLSEEELVYIAKVDSNRSISTMAQPGYRKPLYCTGLGKVSLAFLPEDEKNLILNNIKLIPITKNTITDMQELKNKLKTYSNQGYSIDDEENEEGLYCLAAPVFGADRQMVAAISVAGPRERMIKQKEFIVENILQTSNEISRNIGYL